MANKVEMTKDEKTVWHKALLKARKECSSLRQQGIKPDVKSKAVLLYVKEMTARQRSS